MNSDVFRTISEPGYAQTRVLGSRFFGTAFYLPDAESVQTFLDQEKVKYHDATHHCYAFRSGITSEFIERGVDAGEPKGTAGLPILHEIQSRDLTDTLVIVTRYFGGTKLGTGGLVRAYSECAALALDAAAIVVKRVLIRLKVVSSFDDIGTVYHIAGKSEAAIELKNSEQGAMFEVMLPRDKVQTFTENLREASGGRATVTEVGTWIS